MTHDALHPFLPNRSSRSRPTPTRRPTRASRWCGWCGPSRRRRWRSAATTPRRSRRWEGSSASRCSTRYVRCVCDYFHTNPCGYGWVRVALIHHYHHRPESTARTQVYVPIVSLLENALVLNVVLLGAYLVAYGGMDGADLTTFYFYSTTITAAMQVGQWSATSDRVASIDSADS